LGIKHNNDKNVLLYALRKGNKSAFEDVFMQYHIKVFNFLLSYNGNIAECEEITQDVFVKLWEKRKFLDPDRNFNSYLFTIARNLLYNSFKKKGNEKAYIEYIKQHIDFASNDTENYIDTVELEHFYNTTLESMPQRRKEVFLLSRQQGYSYNEIASELSISVKTVEVHLSAALRQFRAAFSKFFK